MYKTVALFMPQMWVTFAHVVSLKLRSCSTVKTSCFQMWLLDIPWGVLYKSSFPGPNVQRFRGLTRGPGSCIESQPIKYIYIYIFFFFQSFVGVLIAHLGTAGMRYGMSGPQLCICTWVVQRNVCLFCVECIQQRVSTRCFLREGSVSRFLLPLLLGWEQHGDRWWNPACGVQGLSVRSDTLLPGWQVSLSGCVTLGKSFSFPSQAL